MATYEGGCHCGAVRYRAELGLQEMLSCNCSHCSAKGLILSFAMADALTLERGEDMLTEYRFNKQIIAHLFCRVCGVQSFARGKTPDGRDMVAVNLRCVSGIDVDTLTPVKVNNRD